MIREGRAFPCPWLREKPHARIRNAREADINCMKSGSVCIHGARISWQARCAISGSPNPTAVSPTVSCFFRFPFLRNGHPPTQPSSMERAVAIKSLLVPVALSLALAGFYGLRMRSSPATSVPAAGAHQAPTSAMEVRRKNTARVARRGDLLSPVTTAHPPAATTDLATRIISQGTADFTTGNAYNLAMEGHALRLAPDTSVLPGTNQAVGVYLSPVREIKTPMQQVEEAFDTIHFEYDVTTSAGSTVKFEFRTIAVDEEGEGWSAWTEITPEDRGNPITLERMAEKWQYRVLLAHAPGGSSEIRNIKVVTHQDAVKAAQLFNYGSP